MRLNFIILMFIALLAAVGCEPKAGAGSKEPVSPAKVEKHPVEADLATITLTTDAETRLGIKTAQSEIRRVDRVRMMGGEVVVPPGLAITVSAPIGGSLVSPAGTDVPQPGQVLAKDQPIFSLNPLLSPEARISMATSRVDAEGAVAKAIVEVDAARIAFERAELMFQDGAGSRRAVDDARARFDLAKAVLKSAESQRDFIAEVIQDEGAVNPLQIMSPLEGMLIQVFAVPGQLVAGGAPLFQVASLERLWIRVPVYVGDLPDVDTTKEVLVGELNGTPGTLPRTAHPISAPPSADADATTVDLFYEIDNKERKLRSGQKVGVTLFLQAQEENLTVPWQAVLYDIHGGAWVYEMTGPQIYTRKRVQVRFVSGTLAVLAQGPQPGARIVTDGAAELFGTEFGVGK